MPTVFMGPYFLKYPWCRINRKLSIWNHLSFVDIFFQGDPTPWRYSRRSHKNLHHYSSAHSNCRWCSGEHPCSSVPEPHHMRVIFINEVERFTTVGFASDILPDSLSHFSFIWKPNSSKRQIEQSRLCTAVISYILDFSYMNYIEKIACRLGALSLLFVLTN